MGETENKLRALIHDVKHSWYFRVWGLLWIVCAVVVFAAFIILSKQSAQTFKEKDVQFWVENATQIYFPRFHFRTQGGNETIANLNCMWNSQVLAPKECPNTQFNTNMSFCQTIYGDSVYGNISNGGNYSLNRIYCNLTTTNNTMGWGNNTMITWEIETEDTTVQFNPFNPLFIAPNSFAWIMLEKSVYTSNSGVSTTLWSKDLLYHSTLVTPGQYNTVIIIGSYYVWHIEQANLYSGMMSTGEVGGFAFFTVILHSIVMLIVGMCMENNSSFLTGKEE